RSDSRSRYDRGFPPPSSQGAFGSFPPDSPPCGRNGTAQGGDRGGRRNEDPRQRQQAFRRILQEGQGDGGQVASGGKAADEDGRGRRQQARCRRTRYPEGNRAARKADRTAGGGATRHRGTPRRESRDKISRAPGGKPGKNEGMCDEGQAPAGPAGAS